MGDLRRSGICPAHGVWPLPDFQRNWTRVWGMDVGRWSTSNTGKSIPFFTGLKLQVYAGSTTSWHHDCPNSPGVWQGASHLNDWRYQDAPTFSHKCKHQLQGLHEGYIACLGMRSVYPHTGISHPPWFPLSSGGMCLAPLCQHRLYWPQTCHACWHIHEWPNQPHSLLLYAACCLHCRPSWTTHDRLHHEVCISHYNCWKEPVWWCNPVCTAWQWAYTTKAARTVSANRSMETSRMFDWGQETQS